MDKIVPFTWSGRLCTLHKEAVDFFVRLYAQYKKIINNSMSSPRSSKQEKSVALDGLTV